MLKWLTDWGWFCFAGGWRRVASRHRWSETKMIKMVWCVGWGVSFGVCWVWGVVLLFLFLFLLMDLMDVDLWLILADFVSRFHADVFGLRRADCWHGPWYYLKLPMDLTRLNIDCHWLSCFICPYLSIFVPVHPCSSLFQFAIFLVLWRCGWSSLCRLLSASEVDDGQADGVVALWGGRPGRTTGSEADSRRSLGHRKSSREHIENISRNREMR